MTKEVALVHIKSFPWNSIYHWHFFLYFFLFCSVHFFLFYCNFFMSFGSSSLDENSITETRIITRAATRKKTNFTFLKKYFSYFLLFVSTFGFALCFFRAYNNATWMRTIFICKKWMKSRHHPSRGPTQENKFSFSQTFWLTCMMYLLNEKTQRREREREWTRINLMKMPFHRYDLEENLRIHWDTIPWPSH